MSPDRLLEGIKTFGGVFVQFYGQTEAPQCITTLRKVDHDPAHPRRLGSCGRPNPLVEVKLFDFDMNEVKRGEAGEICVRGALVMNGYWKRPDATAGRVPRRLAAHRRRRGRGRGRLLDHRRPGQGHDHLGRLQHLSPRSRGCAHVARLGRLGGGDRRAGRQMGRSGKGFRRAESRRKRRFRHAACACEGEARRSVGAEIDRLRPSRSPSPGLARSTARRSARPTGRDGRAAWRESDVSSSFRRRGVEGCQPQSVPCGPERRPTMPQPSNTKLGGEICVPFA